MPGSAFGEALDAHRRLADVFRDEYGRVLSVLVAELREFDLAEEALGDAMTVAAERWPAVGVPREPAGWLLAVARRRAIDRLRRAGTARRKAPLLAVPDIDRVEAHEPDEIPDERLRLLFTACHPALSREAQVALTLRVVAGLTTVEIARAFLVPDATMGQRISRAKRKIADAGIPYAVPAPDELEPRLVGVRTVIYLIFTEGHTASGGGRLQRGDLQTEAIRLAEILHTLRPDDAETTGLLALLLLTAARAAARGRHGRPVPLAEQDRRLWDRPRIARGLALVHAGLRTGRAGPLLLQAAIAAEHARAERYEQTDWPRIVACYDRLLVCRDDPVVRLNRAVAVMERGDPRACLFELTPLADALSAYPYFHVARAEALVRLGRRDEAVAALRGAIDLTDNAPLRAELMRRVARL